MNDSVIRAEGLGKVYSEGGLNTAVFSGLDFEVARGETVAILGASGAGKSTLLHLLGGLDTPSTGEVFVDGHRMSALSDAARGKLRNRALGFVYQFHHLLPEFTALENVMLPVLLAGSEVKEATARARALLEAVGLGKLNDRRQDFVIGSVLLLRAEALDQVGPFDEDFFLYAEETDWARRAALMGWRHKLVAEVVARHTGAGTSADPVRRETHFLAGQERYLRKHHDAEGWILARVAGLVGAVGRARALSGARSRDAQHRARLLRRGPLAVETADYPRPSRTLQGTMDT